MKVVLETLMIGFAIAVLSVLLSTFVIPTKACAAEIQVGQASWYGGFHHGRKMANGKPFNMYANTVAHRTLPLGTVVQVINRNNGRSVTATVTDRGPYAKRRVLDVSRGIANKLDMIKTGTASVEITVLSKPERKSRNKYERSPEIAQSKIKPNVDSIENLLIDLNLQPSQQPLLARNQK